MGNKMKNLLRRFLAFFGLILASDHERFRQSCVKFCEKTAARDAFVLKSGQIIHREALDRGVTVVGDNAEVSWCRVRGPILVAPWVRGFRSEYCASDKEASNG